ncbi:uncharacterized protein LOC134268161 [Saccostrea cucullata]|uniref:uncharacterized protein LOC134268161 n=1 Tax=Saccostrea cuccullata TaxID=36930 RepID=UPI002ECFD03E
MKAILLFMFCCKVAFTAVQGSTTKNYQVTLTYINETFRNSDVYLPYSNYGRIRIFNTELCSDTSSVDRIIGETLCRSKGLNVGVIGRDRLYKDNNNTLDISCSSVNISDCRVTRHADHCSHVVYLYCDDKGAVHSSHVPPSGSVSHVTKTTTIDFFGSQERREN